MLLTELQVFYPSRSKSLLSILPKNTGISKNKQRYSIFILIMTSANFSLLYKTVIVICSEHALPPST